MRSSNDKNPCILNEAFFDHLKEAFGFRENEVLKPAAKFQEHWNWNSLTGLLTLNMFLSEYELHLDTEEFIACVTFQDLFDLAKKKLEADSTCTV